MTTIEDAIVLSLLAIILLGLTGLQTLAISTGTAAETSSVATKLARAAPAFYTIDGTLPIPFCR
jgi:Tfp pilus assembly protein PilV